MIFSDYERVDEMNATAEMSAMCDEFRRECDSVCPNRDSLSNIILDICYTKSSSKKFAWKMCSEDIIDNLLANNDYVISFPVKDPFGDICYAGERFRVISKRIEENED